MSVGETYLLSSDELNLVAAASGIESFLMFFHPLQTNREQQIKSVFRLMNDGLLIGKGTTIGPGPSLAPLLKTLKQASTAIIAKLSSCEAAPVCIYYDDSGEQFLRIVPHAHKKGAYEVGIVGLDLLLEDFESLHFLPMLRDRQIIDNNSVQDDQWDSEVNFVAVEEPPLSTFEKFNLSTKVSIGEISIVQTPVAWCLTQNLITGTERICYSRHSFAAWLKGELG